MSQKIRRLFIASDQPSILREATNQQAPILRPMTDRDGDAELNRALGGRPAMEALAAPITTSGRVLSILYGDNLSSGGPIGATAALEMVLNETGLQMERELLQKRQAHFDTLRHSEGESSE